MSIISKVKNSKIRYVLVGALIVILPILAVSAVFAQEVELLTGMLPSDYEIYKSQPSCATDRNSSTYINLRNRYGDYYVIYTLPVPTTITGYEIEARDKGAISFIRGDQQVLWTTDFAHSVSKTPVLVSDVKHIRIDTKMPIGGDWLYIYELYVWGLDSTPPAAPSNLQAVNVQSKNITLAWDANTETDLSGYRIYRGDSKIVDIDKDTTNYTDNTVVPGITYTYYIAAYDNSNHESNMSELIVTTPPATPTNMIATISGKNTILSWECPGNPKFIVERSADGINFTQVAEVSETTYTETAPLWDTTYYYRVAQKGQDGTVSEYTGAVQVTTEPVPAPTGLIATREDNNINLLWQAVDGVDTYIVERSTDGESWETIATASTTTYTDAIEDAGIEYLYRVRADAGNQVSAPSNVAGITIPPSPPDNVQASVDGKKVTLTWDASGNAVAYIIERSADGISWEQITEQSELIYQDIATRWDTSYQYRVKSKNAEGLISAPSDPVQVTTPSVPVPKNLEASVTDNQITLSWDAVPGINQYRLQRSENGVFWNDLVEVEGTTYTDRDLEWEKAYYYRVKSVDGDQESDYTASIMAETEPKLMPSAPKISYTVDNTNIKLTWDSQDVSGYRVYINDDFREELPGNATTYSFTGEAGQTYKIRLEAFNPYGTATATLTVKVGSFTTPGAAKMVGDIASNAGVVFGSLGGLLALSLAFKGAGPLIDAARKVIGL